MKVTKNPKQLKEGGWDKAWSKPAGLEVRLPLRPAMKSEATNEKNRYSLKRVPNYF